MSDLAQIGTNNLTGPDGAVAMSSTNGPVGTSFASRYRLQPSVSPLLSH